MPLPFAAVSTPLTGSTTTAVADAPSASHAAHVWFDGLHAGVVPLHWVLVQQSPGTQIGEVPQQMSAGFEHVVPGVAQTSETHAWLVVWQMVDGP